MSSLHVCPQCEQPLAADAPDGLCPQCLLKAATASAPSPSGDGLECDIIDIGDPAEVGKKLPQFEIHELLGRGGMGVVYQARQTQLDRVVALKILPPVDALSVDFIARFTREARALAKLNHPNIVHVYDFGETGGLYYIIMEFVDGTNLRELLETRKLTPAEALAIVPKICDALEYAHEEGIVHRDIKPENILIDKKGRVKIADFGLAKLLRREALDMTLTLSGTSLGTVRYMAPEQMDKPDTVDHRADLYSLGVVIYEMLTGEVPVGRYDLPSQKAQVDVRLDEIVLHALEREPARRYQHASEVREDVEKVTSGPRLFPPPAVPPSALSAFSEEPQLSTRALVGLLWGVLGLAAITCIVLAILDWQHVPDGLRRAINILGLPVFIWALFAVSSVIGSIVLGSHAILQIKASGGRRYGLPVAAAATLLYPLLVVGTVSFYVTNLLATTVVFNLNGSIAPEGAGRGTIVHSFVVLDTLVALLVCFLVGRRAWHSIASTPAMQTGREALPAKVKANFPPLSPEPVIAASRPASRTLLSIALGLLFLFGFFFAFTFHAEQSGPAGTNRILIGAIDPLFTWIKTPTSTSTGFNFLSWSFLAAVIAGVSFSALWRVGREDRGKVPRDPAWWREWWKQVGVWGGLLLVGCLVRTIIHPEAVLHSSLTPPRPSPAQRVEAVDGQLVSTGLDGRAAHPAALPVKQPFMIGYGGPELTNEAVQKLRLSKLQSDEIGRILLSYHREYLALQRRHSRIGKDDAGRLLVTIEPFSEECLALAQRLQTELGGIVDATLLPVIENGEMATQIFGWGGACHETIALWKADGKYYVEEKLTSAPGHDRDPYTFHMSGPKLEEIPEAFRIYWRE